MFDVRLKENFKLFVSGPSRCGKTFFIADLLQNITKFAKQPPTLVVYIYKVWQTKFDEMRKLVHVFLKDEDDVVDRIKDYATGVPILVVFDDMINSKSLATLAPLFTVDARRRLPTTVGRQPRRRSDDIEEASTASVPQYEPSCEYEYIRDLTVADRDRLYEATFGVPYPRAPAEWLTGTDPLPARSG